MLLLISIYRPEKVITGIGNRVQSITLLENNQNIVFRQEHDRIFLDGMNYPDKNALPRVLKLELEGLPVGIPNPVWPLDRFRTC